MCAREMEKVEKVSKNNLEVCHYGCVHRAMLSFYRVEPRITEESMQSLRLYTSRAIFKTELNVRSRVTMEERKTLERVRGIKKAITFSRLMGKGVLSK
jgi:hypothetical protein